MRATIAHSISYLPFAGILMLVALLPFPFGWAQRATLYMLAVAYPLDYIVNRRWEGWHWTMQKMVYVAFVAFFALIPIWQLFDPIRTDLFAFTLDHYAPFLVIGICGLAGMTDKIRLDYTAWVMLGVSTAIVLYLTSRVGLEAHSWDSWVLMFNELRVREVNTHMVVNLYYNLSLIFGALVIIESRHTGLVKMATALLMLPAIMALLISEGRTGIITLLLVALVLLLYYTIRDRRWWLLALTMVLIAGAALVGRHNAQAFEKPTVTNPRVYIWKVMTQMIAERPMSGYGVCSAREELIQRGLDDEDFVNHYVAELQEDQKYRQNGVVQYEKMHPHNVLLETWTQFGIIGVLLILLCLLLPFFMRLGQTQLYLDLCVSAFVIQACFESLGSNLQPLMLCLPVLLFDYASRHPLKNS